MATRPINMSKQILAPLTGTMFQVLVKVADTVNIGDTVAIIESMKMEMPIEAEHEGVVTSIDTSEGAVIEEGSAIVTLG